MKDFPVRVRPRIPTFSAWTTHKTILLVCLSHFKKIMHALNVLGGVSVSIHPLPVHLRASYLIFRENFVFATLVFANFAYATLEFDISLLPLLAFDNTSQMPFRGKNDNFSFHFCHS